MKRAHVLLVVLGLSSGCLRHVVRMTSEWRGRPIEEAVRALGPADSVTPNGSTTLYLWVTSRSTRSTGGAWRGLSASRTQEKSCEGWFVVETSTGLIQEFNERGNDC